MITRQVWCGYSRLNSTRHLKYSKINTNNYYTTYLLTEYLLQNGLTLFGTMIKTKKKGNFIKISSKYITCSMHKNTKTTVNCEKGISRKLYSAITVFM